jgi:glycosyltransferase involved in cell wall biosynthesis
LKILAFNWRDTKNPAAGGAEVYTHELLKRMVARGNEVTLFTSRFKDSEYREFVDGIEVIRAGGRCSVYWKARKYYRELFSRENFDLVLDEINTIPFFTPKFIRKTKIFALIHQLCREFWFYELPFPANLIGYYYLENKWLRDYAELPTITVPNSTKKDLADLGFTKISIVNNGANVNPLGELPEKSTEPTVIFLGRMKKAKKPSDALRAFKLVKKRVANAKLWMVGDGYARKSLEKESEKGTTFFGHVDEKKKNGLLRKAWVIVVPSVREGWGQVVIDANALGTPAVAYDIPGLRDSVVHGKTGVLVNSGDTEKLAYATMNILENEALRLDLSRQALKWAGNFNWDQSATDLEKILASSLY